MSLKPFGYGTLEKVCFSKSDDGHGIYPVPFATFYPRSRQDLPSVTKSVRLLCTLVTDDPHQPHDLGAVIHGHHEVVENAGQQEVCLNVFDWTPEMIQAFKGVVDSLAFLYGWQIIDEEVTPLRLRP